MRTVYNTEFVDYFDMAPPDPPERDEDEGLVEPEDDYDDNPFPPDVADMLRNEAQDWMFMNGMIPREEA